MPAGRRSSVFAYSDIRDAAEQFVEALAEHSDPHWEPGDIAALANSLTERALLILRSEDATFNAR